MRYRHYGEIRRIRQEFSVSGIVRISCREEVSHFCWNLDDRGCLCLSDLPPSGKGVSPRLLVCLIVDRSSAPTNRTTYREDFTIVQEKKKSFEPITVKMEIGKWRTPFIPNAHFN